MGDKPFDGAISAFFDKNFPKAMRRDVEKAGKNDILSDSYPYPERMDRDDYEDMMRCVAEHTIRPMIASRHAMDDAVEALQALQQGGHFGKRVISIP